jgi:hypothetical protein
LKLQISGSEERARTSGKYQSNLYGKNIQIQMGKIKTVVPHIAEAPAEDLQKIGMDILKESIIGIDYGNEYLFLGY